MRSWKRSNGGLAAREKIYQRVAESLEILDGEQSAVPQLYEAARLTGGFPEETELVEISEAAERALLRPAGFERTAAALF